jgi:hypothetical protein
MPALHRGLLFVALPSFAGCSGGPAAPAGAVESSSSGPPTCTSVCNTGFDTCTSRFAGIGNSAGSSDRSNEMTSALGANDVCPDQLKACLRRCLN